MKDLRITDIRFQFRNDGQTDEKVYCDKARLEAAANQSFYTTLASILSTKRKNGIEKTVIDEVHIPMEMWEAGIWERYVLVSGIALFVQNGSTNTEAAEIGVTIGIGPNPATFTDRYIEPIKGQNVMKISNLPVTIICNSISFNILKD